MEEKKLRNNYIFGIILSLFSIYVIIESLLMPRYSELEAFYAAPGSVSLLLGISLLLMGLSVFYKSFRAGYRPRFNFSIENQKSSFIDYLKRDDSQRVLVTIGLTILYVFVLIGRVPYIVSTSIYLFLAMFFYRDGNMVQRTVKPLIISIITSVIIFYSFSKIFMIPLP